MAVFSKEHRTLTKKLIGTVSGFEPQEENFKLCFEYAKLHFRFHRFLDVNDLSVNRAIIGLKEKFQVHSQPEKAASLEDLTHKFLSLHLEKNYPHSDAHYGLLLFLLTISQSPVNRDYVGGPGSLSGPDQLDDFDWTSHLMEGIRYQAYDSDSSSEWSDSTSQSDETTPTKHCLDDSAIGEELLDEGISLPVSSSHSMLLQHVHIPYWDVSNPQHQVDLSSLQDSCLTASAHPACSLATTWSSYVKSMEPLHPPLGDMVTLTEWQVVRETLWACLGAGSSFVYKISDSEVIPRNNIQVLHLTPLSLQRQLSHFSGFISMLRVLRNTCRGVTFNPDNQPTPCRTYEAFSSALRVCTNQLEETIRELESSVVNKVATVTLLSLEVSLSSVYTRVHELHCVVMTVLDQQLSPPSPFSLSSTLLSSLWTSLSRLDALSTSGQASLTTLLPLWLATLRPYFNLIEHWIKEGTLDVKWEEFCIQREECGDGEDWSWVSGFSLRQPVPEFLQPVIHQVLQAGKSMHVIEAIGKRKEMENLDTPTSLYEEFLASLRSSLSHDLSETSHDSGERSPDQTALTWRLDPLAQKYLSYLPVQLEKPAECPDEVLWDKVSSLRMDSPSHSPSFPLTLQHTLSTLITTHCQKSSSCLVRLLTEEYSLSEHFRTVQRFLLMADGPVMHHFCCDIFQRIQEGGEWQDAVYLNTVLHEALQGQFADSADLERRLKVVCSPPPVPSPKSPLACISLHYSVPWPLAMVFPQHLMDTYNKVFQLLLNVNWAKWSLETVHMKQVDVIRLSPPELQGRVRLLLLLRSRLLHFVNNLTNYLMTRILHSVGVEFEGSVGGAADVDTILHLHTQYTETLFDRCLLNKKASIVKGAIMNVLNLAVTFKRHWVMGVANFSTENASRIEDEFLKCSHFLISCLNNTVKRGTFPHLETLAFSMRTLKTGQRVFS